jgi:hypothetical protein
VSARAPRWARLLLGGCAGILLGAVAFGLLGFLALRSLDRGEPVTPPPPGEDVRMAYDEESARLLAPLRDGTELTAEAALRRMEAVLERHPEYVNVRADRALWLQDLGRTEEALAERRRVVELRESGHGRWLERFSSDYPDPLSRTHRSIARQQLARGAPAAAAEACERAIETDTHGGAGVREFHAEALRLYTELGEEEDAAWHARRLEELAPTPAQQRRDRELFETLDEMGYID